ncbi:MAG: Hsp33 family molecular chaperone HslO [Akkermansia sp.]
MGRIFTQTSEPEETRCTTLLRKHRGMLLVRTSRPVENSDRANRETHAAIELPDECHLVTAQPDADEEWLASLTREKMAHLEEDENTRVLETRRFRFYCGCTLDRILPTLKTLQDNKEDLFQGEEELEVTCPRCAAIYRVTKENLED